MWRNKKFILIFKILTIALFTLSICLPGIAESGDPKHLYVITDADIPYIGDTTVSSYKINPATQYLTMEKTNNEWFTGAPLKITVDTDSKCLFVTYSATYGIQIIDGDTMESLGVGLAPPGSMWTGFCAIAMDQDKQLLYALECWTNVLYIFRWDAIAKTLDFETTAPLLISSVQDGYVYTIDAALDEVRDLLFIASYGGTVYYFNTADWSFAGAYTITNPNICYLSIAVDECNGFVYTGNPSDTTSETGLGYLIKYDLSNNQQNYITLDPNNYITGLAVDQATSLLYATTGYHDPSDPNNTRYEGTDEIRIYNSDLTLLYQTSAGVVNPRGLCVPREGSLSLTATPDILPSTCWYNMAPVIITSNVQDICDLAPTCKITDVEVTYNEPPSLVPRCSFFTSRSSSPEWEITGDMTLNVNTQNICRCFADKIFTITVKCTYASGNSVTSQTTVTIQKGCFSRSAAFRNRRVSRR